MKKSLWKEFEQLDGTGKYRQWSIATWLQNVGAFMHKIGFQDYEEADKFRLLILLRRRVIVGLQPGDLQF